MYINCCYDTYTIIVQRKSREVNDGENICSARIVRIYILYNTTL